MDDRQDGLKQAVLPDADGMRTGIFFNAVIGDATIKVVIAPVLIFAPLTVQGPPTAPAKNTSTQDIF